MLVVLVCGCVKVCDVHWELKALLAQKQGDLPQNKGNR
jgi:hypothetical protein